MCRFGSNHGGDPNSAENVHPPFEGDSSIKLLRRSTMCAVGTGASTSTGLSGANASSAATRVSENRMPLVDANSVNRTNDAQRSSRNHASTRRYKTITSTQLIPDDCCVPTGPSLRRCSISSTVSGTCSLLAVGRVALESPRCCCFFFANDQQPAPCTLSAATKHGVSNEKTTG